MRWLILAAILLFIVAQLTRLRPSQRDKQLEDLRKAAGRAGLSVRFWTLRNSGYSQRQLPESGYLYLLPWPAKYVPSGKWALWINASGETMVLAGQPPDLSRQWLDSFRHRFADAWALLECNDSGIGLVWQERGQSEDVQNIADAMLLLRDNLEALPG